MNNLARPFGVRLSPQGCDDAPPRTVVFIFRTTLGEMVVEPDRMLKTDDDRSPPPAARGSVMEGPGHNIGNFGLREVKWGNK